MTKEILDLVEISHTIGEQKELIQGGGGNTSVKLTDGTMAIKASGTLLKDLTASRGIAYVRFAEIQDYLAHSQDGKGLDQFIKEKAKDLASKSFGPPSIETGFHAVLDKYVIHSHSSFANILNCSTDGEELMAKLFPNACWVAYATPGESLSYKIFKVREGNPLAKMFFIESHGLITTAETKQEALELHTEVTNKVKSFFKLDNFSTFQFTPDLNFSRAHILFPDQVVYTYNDDLITTEAAQETLKTYSYLLESLKKNKLNPRFLPNAEQQKLQDMESEKYRRGLLKK